MDVPSRIQAYLHGKARPQREVILVPPFTLYLHLVSGDGSESFAMPHEAVAGDAVSAALPRLAHFFARRDRMFHIQFLDSYVPGCDAALRAAGFQIVERLPVLCCTPGTVRVPPDAPSLTFIVCSAESPLEAVAEGWTINASGFDPAAAPGTPQEIEAFRQSLGSSRSFTARLDGKGVAAGMFTDLEDGVTELVGITTLEPFRRRGIGSALTAYITRTAFDCGADLTFLIAASAGAGRVYERVGYQRCGHLVSVARPHRMGEGAWDRLPDSSIG